MSRLILASASPRRQQILKTLGLDFAVHRNKVDESLIAQTDPATFASEAARQKALDVSSAAGPLPPVLGADTVVDVDGKCLGKPRNEVDSQRMISSLAGRSHTVHTAVCLVRGPEILGERIVSTEVHFRPLSGGVIASYVATGEGNDKAGAYAVQGIASGFVERLDGSYSNVVGLPASQTIELLLDAGVLASWP